MIIEGLVNCYEVSENRVKFTINLAKFHGIVYEDSTGIYLRYRSGKILK